jgi:hypothetical protein
MRSTGLGTAGGPRRCGCGSGVAFCIAASPPKTASIRWPVLLLVSPTALAANGQRPKPIAPLSATSYVCLNI